MVCADDPNRCIFISKKALNSKLSRDSPNCILVHEPMTSAVQFLKPKEFHCLKITDIQAWLVHWNIWLFSPRTPNMNNNPKGSEKVMMSGSQGQKWEKEGWTVRFDFNRQCVLFLYEFWTLPWKEGRILFSQPRQSNIKYLISKGKTPRSQSSRKVNSPL